MATSFPQSKHPNRARWKLYCHLHPILRSHVVTMGCSSHSPTHTPGEQAENPLLIRGASDHSQPLKKKHKQTSKLPQLYSASLKIFPNTFLGILIKFSWNSLAFCYPLSGLLQLLPSTSLSYFSFFPSTQTNHLRYLLF